MPTNDEITVAEVLAKFFQSNIEFVARGISHTPDVYVIRFSQYWEIKNIRGNSSKTIENTLRTAQYQSGNIVISLARSKMSASQAVGRINLCLRRSHVAAKRIIVISKNKKVLVVK